jgi:putative inorganic carbon (hco3(-)) transporter
MKPRLALGLERLACAAIVALPLACWPGLEHTFLTPKLGLLALIDAALAARYLLSRPKSSHAAQAADWAWLAWLSAVALSALAAPYVPVEALLLLALPAPLAFALERGAISVEDVGRAIVAGSTALSLIAVLQYLGADPLRWLGWVPEAFANPRMRVYGTLGNPDFVAAWCAGTLPVVVMRAAGRRGASLRSILTVWLPVALHLAAIVATGSRVFLLALPAAAVVMLALRAPLSKWWLAAAAAVVLAAVWLSPARPLRTTVEGRLYLARVAASGWRHIPLAGYGPGAFEFQFARRQVEWLREHSAAGAAGAAFAGAVDHAHNDYIEMLIELGPVGLGAFFSLSGVLVWRARRNRHDANSQGAWGGVAALAVVALVDFPFHRPAEWVLYWMLLGILGRSRTTQSEVSERIGGENSK